eukprot:g20313.t1
MKIKRTAALEDPSAVSVLLYTDACWSKERGIMAAVLVHRGKFYCVREHMRKEQLHPDYNLYPINFLETAAGVAGARFFRKELEGRRFDHLIDNTCAQGVLLAQGFQSANRKWYLTQAASIYWAEATRHQMRPWLVRVPSAENIADYPTRPEMMAVLLRLYPNFFEEIHDSFGLPDYLAKLLKGSTPDVDGNLVKAFSEASALAEVSDED